MFASWRIGEVQSDGAPGRVFDAAEIMAAGKRSGSHLACNACRARKLRCSGTEKGCLRCLATGTVCTYADPASTSTRQRKKAKPNTSAHTNPPITTTTTTITTTDDAHQSPPEAPAPTTATTTACTPQELPDPPMDDELWQNETGPPAEWPFFVDTEYPWSSLVRDSAIAFCEWQDCMMASASPSSSVGRTLQPSPLLPDDPRAPCPAPAPSGTPDTSSGTPPPHCHCLSRSASVLDRLNAPGLAASPATTDQLIASYRSASQVLHELQECAHCSSRSEVMIIVVIVLQQLLALCEWMVDRQASGTGSEDCELRFGRILVTTMAERESLSHALIAAQCRSFALLFEAVKARAAWMPGPRALLRAMEPRVSAIQARI